MQILLCAATETEIAPTIELLRSKKISSVDILITGVGMTAAAYNITKSVCLNRPKVILQAGIAGWLKEELPLSKVVVIENEIVGDMGVEENGTFKSLFDLKLADKNALPWTDGKLANNSSLLKACGLTGLTIVDGVTVNEISTNKDRISFYQNSLNVSIETMEGAALHYVALMENIPFLQMRSISNYIGERDKSKWSTGAAIAQLNLDVQKILSTLLT